MKILFYATRAYEQQIFEQHTSSHQLSFISDTLSEHTVHSAEGFDAVCVFVNDQVNKPVLNQLKTLGVNSVLLRCAGFNQIDLTTANELGITVARVPAYSPYAVAEHAVALLMALNRHIHKAYNRVREDNFDLNGLIGFDLHGKTVGVIGAGKIGQCFIKIMQGFGCKILVHDPMLDAEKFAELSVTSVSLTELFQQSDVISLHCPLNAQNKYLIGQQAIAQFKRDVVLINTSRGGLLDTRAIIDALKSQKMAALGLDVYEEESALFFADHSNEVVQDDLFQRLLTFPNVLITGHQGFLTQEALTHIAQTTLDNATAIEKSGTCVNCVVSE